MSLITTQKPETFLLSQEQQDKLPPASREALEQVDQLKYFLATAPSNWQPDQIIRRYQLPTGEYVSCVLWDNLFHITGTDIVRSLTYRFFAFGRPVVNTKKFEEGIFSDLRNLKPGTDASLEEPKSEFLDLLYKNNCIRTQKKQKVFYWFSVPHDRLFLDALERDLKREKMNQEPTTRATAEPALSFYYDSSMTLFDQLTKAVQQSNSSANAMSMNRSRTQSIGEYQPPPHSRQHSRQLSEMMPPPAPQMSQMNSNSSDDFVPYMMPDNQLELEPAANIVQRQMESSPFVPMPYGQHQYRNPAMSCPPFTLEYSPAPSFASHISPDDYAQGRAMTYAPETPPQSQPGIYSMNSQMHPYGFPTPESSVTGDMFTPHGSMTGAMARSRPSAAMPNMTSEQMNVLQGSPTYKQRRRRTSITQHMNMGAPHPPSNTTLYSGGHRPRAASVADGSFRNSLLNQGFQRHTTPLRDSPYSRTATPGAPSQLSHSVFQANDELVKLQLDHDERFDSASPMPMDMRSSVTPGPGGDRDSPAKTFTCPVPACGRLFKRLEHLKRHVRTHTQERPYVCGICSKKFSRSDNLAQHRKTHERSGATHSPSARNTPCDSTRNTPVSGDEEHRSDESQHDDHYRYADQNQSNGTEYQYQGSQSLHQAHFRSFSHDGHLNSYGITPTSHGISHFNSINNATPPNEIEEGPPQGPEDDHSPTDSDGSHSYHEEAPPTYAHQTNYSGMSVGNTTLTTNGELKNEIAMIQADPLRKDYLTHPQIMDPSMMNQGWGYQ